MESLSTVARQVLDQMEQPQVDQITGLNPTVAIEQRTVNRNPRSTVGSITDIFDYLRLLFARVGVRHCPQCGRAVTPQSAVQLAHKLAALPLATHFHLMAPGCGLKEKILADFTTPDRNTDDYGEFYQHLVDSIKLTYESGNGYLVVALDNGEEFSFCDRNACPHCRSFFFELTPALFSFNNPEGMCPECHGLGVKMEVDPDLIVTNPGISLLDGASPWFGDLRQVKPSGNWMRSELFALADHLNVDLELPWQQLPQDFRHAVLYGTGDKIIKWSYQMKKRGRSIEFERPVTGAVHNIKRLLSKTSSAGSRDRLLQFTSEQACPACQGERLCLEARFVAVDKKRFPEIATMTIAEIHLWLSNLVNHLDAEQSLIAGAIVNELTTRLQSILNVGLHYLNLDRSAPTLSGGEAQRLRLASQLGNNLTGLLYVLDEPSIGLHPHDHLPLLNTLKRLRDQGNTVVVVEHDADTMRAADWLIDLGPGAGEFGGNVVAAGTPATVMANASSLTGKYLSGKMKVTSPNLNKPRTPAGWLTIFGATLHNLKGIDVRLPLGVFSCITGVSGSGKSSLVTQTLAPALYRALHGSQNTMGSHSRIDGLDQIDKVITINQAPIGRTPRSNPATYVEVFDEIRKVFASTPEAKKRKYKVNHFSFNARTGRCDACEGYGKRRIEMHFLPDAWVTCSECDGQRYKRQILEINYNDKTIADVLELDVKQALEFFAEHPEIIKILQTLHDVGLDYLKLGQSALTLSGGEAQRVKLAKELSRPDTGRTVYILDEPTTGLHFADIQKLLETLHRLTDAGNTIMVIEHNLDVIKTADWIIDLGPEGGAAGGYIVGQGPPAELVKISASYTGQFLIRVFKVCTQ